VDSDFQFDQSIVSLILMCHFTECYSEIVSTPASCLEDPESKARGQLSLLKYCFVFLDPGKC